MQRLILKHLVVSQRISLDTTNPFFLKQTAHLLKSNPCVWARGQLNKNINATVRAVFAAAGGDSIDLTGVSYETEALLDLWNVEVSNVFDKAFSLTLGQQELSIGDGFLIWDGHSDKAAIWSGQIRSFLGANLSYQQALFGVDMFAVQTRESFIQFDALFTPYQGRSKLYGVNVHSEQEAASWGMGLFYRDDDSALENDTLSLSLRASYNPRALKLLTLAGELVKQTGKTRTVDGMLTNSDVDRDALGGHLDIILNWNDVNYAPYVKMSYIHYSGDNPTTAKNEAF